MVLFNSTTKFFTLFIICLLQNGEAVYATRQDYATQPVVIIGAGMAGAKLAYDFHIEGIPYVLVEATGRVGGRMLKRKLSPSGNSLSVEAGANWIQGYREGKDEFQDLLLKTVKLKTRETNFDDAVIVDNGIEVSDDVADPVWERFDKAFLEIYRLKNRTQNIDISIKSALRFAAGWEATSSIEKVVEKVTVDYEWAMPASTVSLKNLPDHYDPGRPPIQDLFVNDKRGYAEAVRWHLRRAGIKQLWKSSPRLRLRSPVIAVKYDSRRNGSSGARVSIWNSELKKTEKISASAVVCTVSIGVLQSSLAGQKRSIKFRPILPEDKRLAISKLELVDYMKYYVKFKKPIFQKDEPEFIHELQCRENDFINVMNLNKDGYYPGENTVLVTATDSMSRDLQCLSKAERLNKVLEFVSRVRGRKITPPEVETHYIQGWANRPYFKGAFAVLSPGTSEKDIRALKKPVGALFFAGDAYADDLRGYVNGAWRSGAKTANDVISLLRP